MKIVNLYIKRKMDLKLRFASYIEIYRATQTFNKDSIFYLQEKILPTIVIGII